MFYQNQKQGYGTIGKAFIFSEMFKEWHTKYVAQRTLKLTVIEASRNLINYQIKLIIFLM